MTGFAHIKEPILVCNDLYAFQEKVAFVSKSIYSSYIYYNNYVN